MNDVCPGEKTAQSKVEPNPGPVQNNETLARIAISSYHLDDNRNIDKKFIKVGELRDGGCSFDRKEICGESDIHRRGVEREKLSVKYIGYMETKTETIRNIRDNKDRQAFVFWMMPLKITKRMRLLKSQQTKKNRRFEICGISCFHK